MGAEDLEIRAGPKWRSIPPGESLQDRLAGGSCAFIQPQQFAHRIADLDSVVQADGLDGQEKRAH